VALSGRPAPLLAQVAQRVRRPALVLLSFVLLARMLARAGIPQALAQALADSFGSAAPYAAPLLAAAAGFFGGTNVASNAAMMPLQAALGRLAGLDPVVLPAVQNGTPFLMISLQLTAIAAGLAGGTSPGEIWRFGWPIGLMALAVGVGAILLG
jgi:lactate permease